METVNLKEFDKAPVWLSVEYMCKILKKFKNNKSIKITKMHSKAATAKGENYASIMTRLSVDYVSENHKDNQHEDFVVKSSYEGDPFLTNIFNSYNAMENEMCVYEKILPAFTDLLKQTGEHLQMYAETIYVDHEHKAIILQDLMPLKYSIGDRLQGFSLQQSKMVMEKIAKMHAAAVLVDGKFPDMLKKFIFGLINEHAQGFTEALYKILHESANFAKSCKELGPYYYEKLIKLQPFVQTYCIEARKAKPERFNTLIHGDLWLNNILIRQNPKDGTTENMILIDFQFSAWAPATFDLHYFFNTSMKGGINDKNEGVLLQHYHRVLEDTFFRLNYGGHIPTLHDIWVQYEETRFIGFISGLSFQPIMINPKTEDADIHALMDDNERARNFRKQLFDNPVMQRRCKMLLPMLDEHGLLDVQ